MGLRGRRTGLALIIAIASPSAVAQEPDAQRGPDEELVPHEELVPLVRHPVHVEQHGMAVSASYPGRPPGCVSGRPEADAVVIRTDVEYEEMIRTIYTRRYAEFQHELAQSPGFYAQFADYTFKTFLQECNHFPPIAFEQQTLLGKWVPFGGMKATVTPEVRLRSAERELRCVFRLTDAPGPHGEIYFSGMWQWLLVPRVAHDTTVDFEIVDARTKPRP